MGKLILQVQISLDGFVAGPSGEMDWINWAMSPEVLSTIDTLTKPINHILMGRKLASGFIPHWLARPSHETAAAIDKINSCKKTVFTRNTELANNPIPESWTAPGAGDVRITAEDLVATVKSLKAADDNELVAYGGAEFVSSLLSANLVDDLYLFMHPVALGKGMPIFSQRLDLQLVSSQADGNGVLILHYSRKDVDGEKVEVTK